MNFPDISEHVESDAIAFHVEDVDFELNNPAAIVSWLLSIAAAEGRPVLELNFIFCSDEYLHAINLEYLQHDYYTDIITFPYQEDAVYGDAYISIERVRENAAAIGMAFEDELHRILAHAVLHLSGYSDKSPELQAEMRKKEDFYLNSR